MAMMMRRRQGFAVVRGVDAMAVVGRYYRKDGTRIPARCVAVTELGVVLVRGGARVAVPLRLFRELWSEVVR